jgi:hypothetical protein
MASKRRLTDDELRAILEEESESEKEIENQEVTDSDNEEFVVEEASDDEDNVSIVETIEDEIDVTDNEMEASNMSTADSLQYISRDGTVWHKNPPPQSRTR